MVTDTMESVRSKLNDDRRLLRVDGRDNVLIALAALRAGEEFSFAGETYKLLADVPAKHKFATVELQPGEHIIMYGVCVGTATKPIHRGEAINTANVQHQASGFHVRYSSYQWSPLDVSRWNKRTFQGYARSDGQAGTRNYWLVA